MAMIGPADYLRVFPAHGLIAAGQRGLARGRAFLVVAGTVLMALGAGAYLGLVSQYPVSTWTVFLSLLALPLLWRRPAWAVYGLVLGAVIFEFFSLNYPDSLTDRAPFFQSYSRIEGGRFPLPITPAEFLILSGLMVLMLRRMAQRERPLEGGPLALALGFFSLTVLLGFLHGISTGGALSPALWEMRPLLYLFPAYLLAFNLVRTPQQIKVVFWLFLGAVALKGIVGSWRYLFTLEANLDRISALSSHNSLMSHEESIFFALFLIFILVMWLVRGGRDQMGFALLLSPPVLLAFLANQRRVGTLALVLGAMVTGLLVYVLVRHRRRLIKGLALAAAVVFPVYLITLGGGNGLLAEPARAIASVYQPDDRDLSSNVYRAIENRDLQRAILSSPILGQGFGKPIDWDPALPDLSHIFVMWEYIPHNTLLWLWLRAGFVGFVAFWFLVGRFMVEAGLVAKSQRDPYLLGVAILSIAATLAWLAMAALDQGLIDYRTTIMMGVFMGLVARMSVNSAAQGTSGPARGTERIAG